MVQLAQSGGTNSARIPTPYSGWLFRHDFDEVRRKFDLDRTNAAFDRTVVVGNSMADCSLS